MAEYAFSTHPSQVEHSEALNSDSISGRQLRKSCRFCRSRKIRCSGETDTGCIACRTRSQPCVYEPTAAMGRPRKYPRTDDGSPTLQSLPPLPESIADLQRAWENPFQVSNYPLASSSRASLAWRPSSADLSASSLFGASTIPSTSGYRTAMGGVPSYSAPETRNPSYRGSPAQKLGGLSLDQFQPSQNHYSTSQVRWTQDPQHTTHIPEPHQIHSTQAPLPIEIPAELNVKHSYLSDPSASQLEPAEQFPIGNGSINYSMMTSNDAQSPEGHFSMPVVSTEEVRQMIYQSDVDVIYQHFKGAPLEVITRCHLEFIINEKPNEGDLDTNFQYPSITSPGLYTTILADMISFLTFGKPSAPDVYEPVSRIPSEGIFARMLASDRGGRTSSTGAPFLQLNPLDHISTTDIQEIYSRFLKSNPFGWLFTHNQILLKGDHQTIDAVLVATIVGWNMFERSQAQSSGHESPETQGPQIYMSYFEFAEAELMKRNLWETHDALPTVQALVLLGAFRAVDGQPRCGWSLLCVAHLLARQATLYTQAAKRAKGSLKRCRSEDETIDSQLNGLFWLLTLVRTWSTFSLPLPLTSVYATLKLGPSPPERGRVHHEWASQFLLDSAQLLVGLCTMNKESGLKSRSRAASDNEVDNTVHWLAEIARHHGQYLRPRIASGNGHEPIDRLKITRNPQANPTLAVIFSILALNRLYPCEEVMCRQVDIHQQRIASELLQNTTTEAAGAVLSAASGGLLNPMESLVLRIMRGAFPYLVALIHATLSNIGTENEVERGCLQTSIDLLSSFVVEGLSAHKNYDQEVVEHLQQRILLLYSPPPIPTSHQPTFDEDGLICDGGMSYQAPAGSAILSTSFSNPTSSKSSSTTTGGSGTDTASFNPSDIPLTASPGELQPHGANFNTSFANVACYTPVDHLGLQTNYNYDILPSYAHLPPQSSMEDLVTQKVEHGDQITSAHSSPAGGSLPLWNSEKVLIGGVGVKCRKGR